jgi:hypothetical protein
MAPSWRKPVRRRSTSNSAFPIRSRADSTSSCCIWCWRCDGSAAPGERGADFGQRLFDAFCRDLDGNLREMGVGDLAVPKRMRRFGEAFYGRQASYVAALAADDPRHFEKALARNILQTEDIDDRAARLARYARAAARQLDALDDADLFGGVSNFPDLEAFADARA